MYQVIGQKNSALRYTCKSGYPKYNHYPGGDEGRKQLAAAFGINTAQLYKAIPLGGRPGSAQEISEMIAFLATDRDSYITGHNHFVTGGQGELS